MNSSLLLLFSNHGSRLIDTAVPAIECLEDIIKVVDGRAEGRLHLLLMSNV
jgi:isopentenyl diphosphate isomerase/L-lactate dehydrogenase-like FMN-dependent dehydrogenase